MGPDTGGETEDRAARFRAFIEDASFPCLGAKSALRRGRLETMAARDIRSGWNDLDIHARLTDFVAAYRADRGPFRSFAVVFAGPRTLPEAGFEQALWERVQSLADKDEWKGHATDPRVSDDPVDPHFSLSVGGEGFFVVGLHPASTRPARRFERPVLVFNLQDQFETLRAEGRYDRLRERILERDIRLAGSANPMLQAFGEGSAAPQYSGRMVDGAWVCPYRGRRPVA